MDKINLQNNIINLIRTVSDTINNYNKIFINKYTSATKEAFINKRKN